MISMLALLLYSTVAHVAVRNPLSFFIAFSCIARLFHILYVFRSVVEKQKTNYAAVVVLVNFLFGCFDFEVDFSLLTPFVFYIACRCRIATTSAFSCASLRG